MKTFHRTTMIIALFLLCTNSSHTQTKEIKLNQIELMKQLLGTWKGETAKDTTLITEYLPFGSANNMNMRRFPEERDSLTYWNKKPDSELSKMKRDYFSFISEFYNHDVGYIMLQKFFATTKFYESMSNLMWNDLSLTYDLKPILINYKGKCSIIRPRQDPVPAESVYQIKELLPQTNIYFIEKSGHFPDYEKPQELFKLLRQVL